LEAPNPFPEFLPFYPANDLAIHLPINNAGKIDVYIENTAGITPEIDDSVYRVSSAIPSDHSQISRPINHSEHAPRRDITSMKNF
jgi:hypothetical protein